MNTKKSADVGLCACSGQIRARLQLAVEEVSVAAIVESRVSVDAEEVALAVAGLLVEAILAEAQAFDLRVLRALESEVAGGVAVWHYIGPVAVIALRTEG